MKLSSRPSSGPCSAWPGGQLAIWVLLAAVAGVIASVGPARKAARLDVLQAIATE